MNQKLPTPQQAANEERAKLLSLIHYPHQIPEQVKILVRRAMKYNSVALMQVPDTVYRNLIKFERQPLMAEVQIIIETLTRCTPVEMGHDIDEHLEMLEIYVYPLMELWRNQDDVLTKKAVDTINARLKITQGVPLKKQLLTR